jgi:tripartite ATP-independent transporter DctP family solute receptor
MVRKIWAAAAAMTLFASAWMVPGVASAQAKHTMKIAGPVTGETAWYIALREFKKNVEAATGGRLEVQVFQGTLGGERQLYEGLRLGTLQGSVATTGPLSSFVPEVGIFNLPFLFSNWDHVWKTVDGPLGDSLAQKTLKQGIRVLGWWQIGTRDIYHNVRPINTPQDVKGMKIRTMESPEFLALYKAYGATAVPMPWPEIYTGLHLGTIDGAEAVLSAAVTQKHFEVVKYVARIEEAHSISPFAVSERWFSKLPKDIQDAIVKAEKDVRKLHRDADLKIEAEAVKGFEKAGVKVTFPDKKPFQAIARSIYPQFYSTVGQANVEAILKAAP